MQGRARRALLFAAVAIFMVLPTPITATVPGNSANGGTLRGAHEPCHVVEACRPCTPHDDANVCTGSTMVRKVQCPTDKAPTLQLCGGNTPTEAGTGTTTTTTTAGHGSVIVTAGSEDDDARSFVIFTAINVGIALVVCYLMHRRKQKLLAEHRARIQRQLASAPSSVPAAKV